MNSRTRSRRPTSIGSNQSSRRWIAVSACDCRADEFVLLLVMAWSPPALKTPALFGFQHPETTPPSISTTPRTAPVETDGPALVQSLHVVHRDDWVAANPRRVMTLERDRLLPAQ